MHDPNTCNCCSGLSVKTPLEVYNRPGLKAVSYRIGTHQEFRQSLFAKLSTSKKEALQQLTSRSDNDFSMALLDAWATVSDVLTFYQERIANESYLRTATEQLSVTELARLIGYQLRPGVAASTYLAFTIEEINLASSQALISGIASGDTEPAVFSISEGTKVQSIPGQDENPQTYETIETIEAKAEWNAMKPRMSQPQSNLMDRSSIFIKGTGNNLKEGNIVLIIEGGEEKLKKIQVLIIDQENDHTELVFSGASSGGDFEFFQPDTYATYNQFQGQSSFNSGLVNTLAHSIINGPELYALIQTQNWQNANVANSINYYQSPSINLEDGVFVFRKNASPFGYNAPKIVTYKSNGRPRKANHWIEWNRSANEASNKINLDSIFDEILPDSYIAIQQADETFEEAGVQQVLQAEIRPRVDYGMSAKTTELKITTRNSYLWYGSGSNIATMRGITVHCQSEVLPVAEVPVRSDVSGQSIFLSQLYLGLNESKTVIITGERTDLPGTYASELRALKEVLVIQGFTQLVFHEPLEHTYLRESVTVNANVALATHGERVQEILGSGDASKTFQKFTLKQPPLTYTSASSPSGTASSLEVRVNDILWKEVPTLYDKGATEQVYVTRQSSEGDTTVLFGDGITGARLPSGEQNVRAFYRKGIGASGILKANQLSMLLDRPAGLKTVTNPFATTGAQDAEQLSEARINANLTIFTLGRIVSLQDYEDFARAFAGITKALATWVWCGKRRCVHLTVAGVEGAEINTNNPIYNNLLDAISEAAVPGVRVIVDSYQSKLFQLEGTVQVKPEYLPEKVLAEVEGRLRGYFSFEQRDFGQSVTLGEVLAVIHQIAGVVSVDLDFLYETGKPKTPEHQLLANVSSPGTEMPLPAELLNIDPRPLSLTTTT